MLVLTFQIGDYRLALDTRRVREVVPRVHLSPVAGGPEWLAGVFVYRGAAVQVVDLHRLLGAGECPPHLASRIILVPLRGGDEEALVGLLAAQVADLREVSPDQRAQPPLAGLGGPDRPSLGATVVEGGRILHLLDLDRLLPDPLRRLLPGP
jgi:chemotaxis-related protein WspB